MPTTHVYDTVHGLALDQHGVFTAEQARRLNLDTQALVMMVQRGRLERLAYGLYRDVGTPLTRWTPYAAAVLWPQRVTGVLSHDTALDMMELSDVNPAKIHVTVPRSHRPRRRQPLPGVTLHHADLDPAEVTSIEGLPVTTAARTIRDCAAEQLGPALIRQAIADGRTKGWLTPNEAERLVAELTADGKL
jgi:predicted transcriptional regulator of viral defense system